MNAETRKSVLHISLSLAAAFLLLMAGFLILPTGAALANAAAQQGINDSTSQVLPFSQNWSNAGLITANDNWSGVPGIVGYLGDYDTAGSPTNVDPRTLLLDYAVSVDVIANQSAPNTLTSGGVAEFDGIADPVVAMQGSGTADAPFLLIHVDTTDQKNIRVQYNVRDVDGSADNAAQQVALHYRVGTSGNFTNLPGGYIADATTGGSATQVTAIDVTLPANADDQPEVQIRIMTTNATGSDEWIGIDDISITGTPSQEFAISKSAPDMVSPSDTFTYTLAVTNRLGLTATNVVITDVLPVSTTFVSASDGGALAGDVISWTVASLPDGGTLTRTFQVVAPDLAGSDIVNDDYAVYASNWLTLTYGAPVTTTISPLDLVLGKTGPAVTFSGETIVYQVTLDNQGVATATNLLITDTLPANMVYVADDSGALTTTVVSDTIIWQFGDVPSNTLLTFNLTTTVSASVPNGTALVNHVEASTDTAGDDPANNVAQWSTTAYQVVPIATARAGSLGQVFAVEGIVTYVPGTYNAAGWALQDASGGIGVYYTPAPGMAYGDQVRLMATRGANGSEEQLTSPTYYFADLGFVGEVTPLITTTHQVALGDTEGWLVYVEGTVSGLTTCSGNYQFSVNDGSGPVVVFVDGDTGVDVCGMGATNGSYLYVTGFSTQFGSTYEIKPRRPHDVHMNADAPQISKSAPAVVVPGGQFTYTITVENFMGIPLDNVTIVDELPSTVTSEFAGNVVRQNLGSLPDQGVASYSFVVTATNQVTLALNANYYVTATESITPVYGDPVSTWVISGSLQIHDIQGAGHTSPFDGQTVQDLRGIVTLLQSTGFYMQCATPDGNPMTSEGIFVFTSSAPTVAVGNNVEVDGLATEFNGMTEITSVSSVTVLGSGFTVAPTAVTFPVPEGQDLEPYESMLVTFPQTLTVNQNYFQGHYGQVTLGYGRMYNPTNGNGLGDTLEYNRRRMIILDDAQSVQYPNPIPYIGEDNTLRAGDAVNGVTGVVDYGLITADSTTRFYRLQPTTAPAFTRLNERTAAPENVGGTLQVASFNVLNYFNGDGLGGGFPTSRGANTLEEFVRQRTKIITAMVSLDADILGLMEIENDGDDSLSAIQDLVNGLNAATAPGTYALIVEPAPGTDEIKVAMIYKPGVVTPVGPAINYQVLDHPVYVPLYDRSPLAQTFQVNASGEKLTVIVNHFKSKGSCPTTPGSPDADYGQGCWNAKRVAQAQGLVNLMAQLQLSTGDPDVLVIGDLNAYGEEDPILALTDNGFVNQLATRVPAEERYSYVFDGFAGYLDQGLATSSLDAQVTGATIWHINADEPNVIDYNMESKPQDLYTPTAYRASDHDPVLLGFNLRPATLSIEKAVTPDADVSLGGVVTYTVVLSNLADLQAYGILLTDTLPAEVTFGGWVAQGGADYQNGTITWEGNLPAGQHITLAFTATVGSSPDLYGHSVVNSVAFTSQNDGSGFDQATFVIGEPLLDITKTVDLAGVSAQAGDVVTYTVVVRNDGSLPALGVHITDTLPAELEGADLDVTVDIGVGEAYTATIVATVRSDLPAGGAIEVVNTAHYTHASGSGSAQASFIIGPAYRLFMPLVMRQYP